MTDGGVYRMRDPAKVRRRRKLVRQMLGHLQRTPTREFLLNWLETRGSLRINDRRYTMSLRVMEEHGYVSRSIGNGKWSLNQRGREALERWQA